MQKATDITCVFVDIGGVPLTAGWDHFARKRAAANCKLEWKKREDRHRLVFNAMGDGNSTFAEYLSFVVFDKARPFTQVQFHRFAQSYPYPEMIELICQPRARERRKIAVVSNEAARTDCLSDSKVQTRSTVGFFVSTCFVRLRKPKRTFSRLALDMARSPAGQVAHIQNTRCSSRSRRAWDLKRSPHGLRFHMRQAGFMRIAGRRTVIDETS